MTIVPRADGRPGETKGELTLARAVDVSVGPVLCEAGGVKNQVEALSRDALPCDAGSALYSLTVELCSVKSDTG